MPPNNSLAKTNTDIQQPKQTGIYRHIIEMSCMSNNDEYILFNDKELSNNDILTTSTWDSPHIVIVRPVFVEEVNRGLDVNFKGSIFDEQSPQITNLIDGVTKFINQVQRRQITFKEEYNNPTNIVADIIAANYYDCMSGGMPIGMLLAARHIIKECSCDLSHEVYGRSESLGGGHYTLADFMEETKDRNDELPESFYQLLLGEVIE